MRNKTQGKIPNMLAALLIAVCIWGYCIVEVNPTSSETIKNIPISYEGIERLESAEYTITSGQIETMNLVVTGSRSTLATIKASDFKVVCEVASLKEGENRVGLAIRIPEGVTIESQSIKNVVLNVEKIITESRTIVGVIINQDYDTDIAEIISLSKDKVKVTGAESVVNSITYVKATVDATNLGNEVTLMDIPLVPVDKYGDEVDDVTLGRKSVSCRAVLRSPEEEITEEPVVEGELEGEEVPDGENAEATGDPLESEGEGDIVEEPSTEVQQDEQLEN